MTFKTQIESTYLTVSLKTILTVKCKAWISGPAIGSQIWQDDMDKSDTATYTPTPDITKAVRTNVSSFFSSAFFLNEERQNPLPLKSNKEAAVRPLTACELKKVQHLSSDKSLPNKLWDCLIGKKREQINPCWILIFNTCFVFLLGCIW